MFFSLWLQRSGCLKKNGKNMCCWGKKSFGASSNVTHVPRPQAVQKVEPAVAEMTQQTPPSALAVTSSSAPVANPPAPTPPKVDYATDLFNMLSMDGSNENCSEATSADDNADWAGFQSAQDASIPKKSTPPKPVESNSKPTRTLGIEDLLKDTPVLTSSVSMR
ncbi:hypothetical protein UlMin_027621 [Ulmus minor]